MTFLQLKQLIQTWKPSIITNNSINNSVGEFKVSWQVPTLSSHGFLTSSLAFQLVKELNQTPVEIAILLKDDLQNFVNSHQLPVRVLNKGPYLNLEMLQEFWLESLNSLDYPTLEQDKKVVIFDYIGCNVAKRLHIGHMRNCNIGDSLRRILSLKYPNLVTDNHWGDWGVNMGILIWGWKNYNHSTFLEGLELIDKLTIIYVWANNQKETCEDWESLVRNEFYLLERKDEINLKLWQTFIQTTKQDAKKDLSLLSVPDFDLEQGESFYESDMNWLTAFLEKHQIWEIEGEARFFDFETLANNWKNLDGKQRSKVSKLGRAYLISSKGYTSYCYRDVGARLQWARDYEAGYMITVTDKTQKHNFDQAFAIISYLATLKEFRTELKAHFESKISLHSDLKIINSINQELNQEKNKNNSEDRFEDEIESKTQRVIKNLNPDSFKHIGYGYLKLETGKMSSRKGNVMLLKDLFDTVKDSATQVLLQKQDNLEITQSELDKKASIVTVSALKWNDLKQFFEQDVIFDINTVLKFEGNTGVYQLYTFARLNSVLQKINQLESIDFENQINILSEEENMILQEIFVLSDCLEQICLKNEPHLLCNYLYEFCNKINKWYNDNPILKSQNKIIIRKQLITKILSHLKFSLSLLGIETLERL
jgi:arginyl-tRNA synthetase